MPRVHLLSQIRPGPRMGMGHYERLLIWHLMQVSSREEWQFDFTCDGRVSEAIWQADTTQHPDFAMRGSLGFSNVRFLDWPWPAVKRAINLRFKAPKRTEVSEAPALFHSLALTFPAPTFRPAVYSIHDLPPIRFSDEGRLPRWSKQAVREARLILTPSHFSQREMIEHLDAKAERVVVVPCGVERERFHTGVPIADADTLAKLGIEGPFLIYVGGVSRRKNVPALLKAWKMVAPNHADLQLVFAGPQELVEMVRGANLERAVPVGYLGRDVLPSVMRAAKALVFPSIYEGFGLPPQEAMAIGVPVIGTKVGGAVLEVVGDAGILAEDGSPEALAEAMELLLGNADLEEQLRQKGPERAQGFWSWSDHARTVLEHYRSVLD